MTYKHLVDTGDNRHYNKKKMRGAPIHNIDVMKKCLFSDGNEV